MKAFPPSWRRGVYEAIARRRDMRTFLPDPIPPATLARLLAAAHHAGSVGFMQPWNFIVIEDRELRGARIPEYVMPVAYLCAGFVAEFPERPMLQTAGWLPRLSLAEVVFSDRWAQPPTPALAQALDDHEIGETTAVHDRDIGAGIEIVRQGRLLIVRFPREHAVPSWAIVGGGRRASHCVAWCYVDHDELPASVDPAEVLRARLAEAEIRDAVGLLTSRSLDACVDVEKRAESMAVRCVATVGLSNALHVGEPPGVAPTVGTINLLVAVSIALTEEALVEALALASEARTAALLEVGIPSHRSGRPATGTGTDCIVIAAPAAGAAVSYAGEHTVLGHLIGTAVDEAVRRGAEDWKCEHANGGAALAARQESTR